MVNKERPSVIIYDDHCPICRRTINWVNANAKDGAFEMVSSHSPFLGNRFSFLSKASCLQAIVLILPDGSVLSGDKALPEILSRLSRYGWLANVFSFPFFKPLTHFLYSWFASRRYIFSTLFFHEWR
ncbi:MAG: DUF393 domain-containing protein [Candidatus Tectomicrobia bacterium]|uniref:DUF393 domain-containing protein n=1 Tax=Tectimicrobiota bacterium TaxID=2528274 RepID=A0A933GLJ1_UNCTE|nr:DUF393 domain-containing protein [Candidatus Tectomicrobia bacterium]